MKRTYRLFALLMAVLMLFGMLPAGYAEGGNQMPGGEFTVGCNHNWDWRYPNGEPKHCQDERLMEMYCTLCGQVASSYTVTGDHTHGSWQWDYTPPANCYEWGIQNEFCSVCGEVFNEREVQGEHQWSAYVTETPAGCETPGLESKYCTVCGEHGDSREIPALGHDWGDWRWEVEATCTQEGLRVRYCKRCNMREEDYVQGSNHKWGEWITTIEPTCMERGRHHHTCQRCGATMWEYIPMVDHVFGEWRVVEEPQVGLPGYERRFCIYQCGTYEEREIPPLEEAISLPGLALTLVLSSTPANGTHFVVGETVVFTAAWANTTPYTLKDQIVSIGGTVAPVLGSELLYLSTLSPEPDVEIAPGASGSHSLTVVVSEADVANGAIHATADFSANTKEGVELGQVTTPFVTAPCGEDSLSTDGLSLSLSLSSTPANGTHFVVGEEVSFTETWANNTDQTLYPFSVSIFTCAAPAYGSEVDQIGSWFAEDYGGPVAPGASGSHTLTVTVTEADVARGAIYAQAELLSTVQDGPDLENVATPYVTAPCAPVVESEAKITKYVSVIPANGEYFVPGETIEYAVVFMNVTEHELHDVEVYDPLKGGNEDITITREPVVPPNGVLYLSFHYVVTEEDAARGTVVNTASAIWLNPETEEWSSCDSNTVTTLCGKPADGLNISWTYTNAPANGEYFTPGEVVDYMATITNTGSVPLNSLAVGADVTMSKIPSVSTIAPGQTIVCHYNDLLEVEDVQSGSITSKAYVTGYTTASPTLEGTVDAVSAPVTVPVGKGKTTPAVYYHKTVINVPANGVFFTEGETIEYKLSLINNGKKDIYSITLKDPLSSSRSVAYARKLVAGDVLQGTFTYVVTAEDVAAGQVVNTATSTWEAKANGTLTTTPSNTVITPCGSDNPGDSGLVDGLTVIKKVTSTPANGSYYVPGETVTFQVYVQNNGEQLNDLDVSDWMWGDSHAWEGTFAAGATVSYPVTYTVTDADARAKHVNNIACVTAIDKDGNQITEYSNLVTVPCGFPEGDDPFGIFHSLALVKKEESMPLNGEFYTEGEVIHYTITYTNDGELPLTDVQVWDNLNINTIIGHAEMLQPGESRSCYYQHTVTAADVAVGGVLNLAQASYPVPGGKGYANVNSNLVFSKTNIDGMHCVVLPPLFPEDGEDPEYDPGTGWFPGDDPITEGDTPPFGSIDMDTLYDGDSYCVRTITGRDQASASYETTFCAVHSPLQTSALVMAKAATTPETQMQAASYAVTLWRTEVQKLYQELFEAADPVAKMVVMTEYTRYLNDIANYEAMLKLLYPDQPALVAMKVAEIWENKCVDLCYDAHATAAERKDSLLAVTPTIGAAAESCACEVTVQEVGKKAEKQSYCPAHSFPFSMTDALLQGKDTAESWTTVRQIWGVELTSAYNKVYEAMGDNQLLAMAEYYALTQWMLAREATLIALYPDNPEIVVQIMVKTIMDRVSDLCMTGK